MKTKEERKKEALEMQREARRAYLEYLREKARRKEKKNNDTI